MDNGVGLKQKLLICSALVMAGAMPADLALAAPQGGQVSAGSASISSSGTKTDIYQNSNKAIIDWNSFDIAVDEHTEFHQPDSGSVALNRIHDVKASQIDGRLTANGHIMLLNQNGVVFGASSQVDVGSLTVTSADIDDDDFMAGDYNFQYAGENDAVILNQGRITAQDAGLVTLVAPEVYNEGIIVAKMGKVQLGAAETFTLDMAGDGLMQVAVTESDHEKIVKNSGSITVDEGYVAMSAQRARDIVDSLVEHSGVIQANSMTQVGGRIVLGGGNGITKVTGTVEATGKVAGGNVDVLGEKVALMEDASIDVSGENGGGKIRVGGDYQGTGDVERAKVTFVGSDVELKANATVDGDGGEVIVWSDGTTRFNGLIEAKGGENGGDGGLAEVSGKEYLAYNGFADLRGDTKGMLLLDPDDIIINDTGSDDAEVSDDSVAFADGSGTFTISDDAIEAQLAAADVTLQANNDITVNADIDWAADTMLVLEAGNDIFVNANITNSYNSNMTTASNDFIRLTAGRDIDIQGDITFTNNKYSGIRIEADRNLHINGTVKNGAGNDSRMILWAAGGDQNATGILTLGANGRIGHGSGYVSGDRTWLVSGLDSEGNRADLTFNDDSWWTVNHFGRLDVVGFHDFTLDASETDIWTFYLDITGRFTLDQDYYRNTGCCGGGVILNADEGIYLNADIVSSYANWDFNDAVYIGDDVSFLLRDSNTSRPRNHNITFNSTVQGITGEEIFEIRNHTTSEGSPDVYGKIRFNDTVSSLAELRLQTNELEVNADVNIDDAIIIATHTSSAAENKIDINIENGTDGLDLSATEMARLQVGTATLTLGDNGSFDGAMGTNDINIGGDFTALRDINFIADNDINIDGEITASTQDINFLAAGDITFTDRLQITGEGDLGIVGGWDGSTGYSNGVVSLSTILADTNAYGNNSSTILLDADARHVAVGSHNGVVTVAGYDLDIDAGTGANEFAQIGWNAHSASNNETNIHLANDLTLTGGGAGSFNYAMIGNGGDQRSVAHGGDITIARANNITMTSGAGNVAFTLIGHGGPGANGSATGNISITNSGDFSILGGTDDDSIARVGHGNFSGNANQSYSGDITINTAGNLLLKAQDDNELNNGEGDNAFVMIGHGANFLDGAIESDQGARSGDISVTVGGELSIVDADTVNRAIIGHRSDDATPTGDVLISAGSLDFADDVVDATDFTLDNANFVADKIATLAGGNVTIVSTGADMVVASDWNYAQDGNDLNFVAGDGVDLTFMANVQNNGTGALNMVAGWDESTGLSGASFDIAAVVADTNAYGNNSGSIAIGDGSQTAGISVGSRNGDVTSAGYNLTLQGENTTSNSGRWAQLGWNTEGDVSASGDISIYLDNDLNVNGGGLSSNNGFNSYAMIGHGFIDDDTTMSGDITIARANNIDVDAGYNNNFAKIGHGGRDMSGSASGNITINAATLDIEAGEGGGGGSGYAQVGHGQISGSNKTLNLSGNIDVDLTGNLDIYGRNGHYNHATLGHGGVKNIGTKDGDINVTADEIYMHISGTASKLSAQIGHGGTDSHGDITGDVSVDASRIRMLADGSNASGDFSQYTQIGHGGWGEVAGDFTTGTRTGDIDVTVSGELSIRNGTTGTGDFATIGHLSSDDTGSGDLLISAGYLDFSTSSTDSNTFTIDDDNFIADMVNALKAGNVTLISTAGDITFANAWTYAQDTNALSFVAGDGVDLTFMANVQNNGTGALNMVAGWDESTGLSGADFDMAAVVADTNAYGNNTGSIAIGDGTQTSGIAVGSRHGDITVAANDLILQGGTHGVDDRDHAQLGWGVPSNATSAIDLYLNNDLSVLGGNRSYNYAMIGHGGISRTANFSGDITIHNVNDINLIGGTSQGAASLIGHGGRGSNGTHSGDITITDANDVVMNARSGAGAYVQIGHGAHYTNGDFSGDITLSSASLTMQSTDSSGYSQIGHGGYNNITNDLTTGARTGDISVTTSGELSYDNSNSHTYIGHRSSSATPSGDVLISAGALDFDADTDNGTFDINDSSFVTQMIANLAAGDVTLISTNADMGISSAWNYAQDTNALNFVAGDGVDLTFIANVQNDGTGALNMVAGWDETTGLSGADFDMAAVVADTNAYGNNTGSIAIGDGTQTSGIAVGSRYGDISVAGYDLDLQGGLTASGSDGYDHAILGWQSTSAANSDTFVYLDNDLTVTGGDTDRNNFAKIGHAGAADHQGDITIARANDILLKGGKNVGYAQIGIGSRDDDGNVSGNIDITANSLTMTAGTSWGSGTQIGHHGSFSDGDATGDITLNITNDIAVSTSSSTGSYSMIGHGGESANGSFDGNIDITATNMSVSAASGRIAYAMVGHGGKSATGALTSGDIDINLSGDLSLRGGTNNADSFAQIGHGGSSTGGEKTGNITIAADDILVQTRNANSTTYTQIGHGTADGATGGARTGDISITATGEISLVNDVGGDQFIGHRSVNTINPSNISISAGSLDFAEDATDATEFAINNVNFINNMIANLAAGDVTLISTNADMGISSAWNYNSANNLSLSTTGTLDIAQALTNAGTGNMSFDGDSGIDLAANITNDGDITFSDAVTLGGNADINAGTGTLSLAAVTAGANDLNLAGNEINLTGVLNGSGDLTLTAGTNTQDIELGSSNAAALNLTGAELSNIQNGWNSITIGSTSHQGDILVTDAVTVSDDFILRQDQTTSDISGRIVSNNAISATGSNLSIYAGDWSGGNTAMDINGNLTAGGDITLVSQTGIDVNATTIAANALNMNAVGRASVTTANDLALGTVTANNVFVQATGSADITLNNTVTAGGSGNSVVMILANGQFNNQAGANAIDADAGRYLVYVSDKSKITRDGLDAGYYYGSTHGSKPPASIPSQIGDRFVLAETATLTLDVNDVELSEFDTAYSNFTYSASGLQNGDQLQDVLGGNLRFVKSRTNPSEYVVSIAPSSVSAYLGYNINLVAGTLTLPKPTAVVNNVLKQIQGPVMNTPPALQHGGFKFTADTTSPGSFEIMPEIEFNFDVNNGAFEKTKEPHANDVSANSANEDTSDRNSDLLI